MFIALFALVSPWDEFPALVSAVMVFPKMVKNTPFFNFGQVQWFAVWPRIAWPQSNSPVFLSWRSQAVIFESNAAETLLLLQVFALCLIISCFRFDVLSLEILKFRTLIQLLDIKRWCLLRNSFIGGGLLNLRDLLRHWLVHAVISHRSTFGRTLFDGWRSFNGQLVFIEHMITVHTRSFNGQTSANRYRFLPTSTNKNLFSPCQ